jgi:hypothetical protein
MTARAGELREWLEHLERWVETQMAATRAFMVLLQANRGAERPVPAAEGVSVELCNRDIAS